MNNAIATWLNIKGTECLRIQTKLHQRLWCGLPQGTRGAQWLGLILE